MILGIIINPILIAQTKTDSNKNNKIEKKATYKESGENKTTKTDPYWILVNKSDIYYGAGNVGIGTTSPSSLLDVNGVLSTNGFRMLGGNQGDVLTYGRDGIAYWSSISGGGNSPWSNVTQGIAYNPGGTNTNVGIGTSNPSEKLEVSGSIKTNEAYTFDSGNDGVISFGSAVNARKLKIVSNYKQGIKTGINGMAITSLGFVGIGIDNPSTMLEVNGKTKTQSLQISGGNCQRDYVLTASDTDGNVQWTNLENLGNGNSIWTEDANRNIYRESGNVGIGTINPEAPLHLDFGDQTIGLKFNGLDYGSSDSYPDFSIETNFSNEKPELSINTSKDKARYIWACHGVDKMILDMVYWGDPGRTRLKLIDGTIETKKLKITTTSDVNGFVLQSDADGDATWVDAGWTPDNNGNIYRNSGKVGIGQNHPIEKLDINGNIMANTYISGSSRDTYSPSFSIRGSELANCPKITLGKGGTTDEQKRIKIIAGNTDAGQIEFWPGGTFKAVMKPDEFVIGFPGDNDSRLMDLKVNGKIWTNEVEVLASGWWDQVFHEDYNLRSLEEVEQFIGENSHLPDIPSEAEVMQNGVNLGEMDGLLLKKIEELTLYIILQQKEIDGLKEKLDNINN